MTGWEVVGIIGLALLAGAFVVFIGNKCPRCGGKWKSHSTYPNASVCEKCNYLRVGE